MFTVQIVTIVVSIKGAEMHPLLLKWAKADSCSRSEAMLVPRLPLSLFMLFSVLNFGCTEAGTPANPANNTATPTSNGSPATGFNINGPHTGTIWTADRSSFIGSNRYNLQTGEKIKFTDGMAFPTRDGSAYVEFYDDHRSGGNCLGIIPIDLINIKDTRTGNLLGSFELNRSVEHPMRLSPDKERVALRVAEDEMDCGSNINNKWLTIMSKDGEELYRHGDDSIVSYDWHPDGRLVIVRLGPTGQYLLMIEVTQGSYIFEELIIWNRAPDVTGYVGLRVSPSGNDAVLEEVLDSAHVLSGFEWRNSRTRHFNMFEDNDETAMFVYEDENPRVNAPTFSPDGQHVLVVESFSSGSVVFNATSLEIDSFDLNPTAFGTDELGTLSVVSTSSPGMAYIVPTSQKLQPMPPQQFSENIRPVLTVRGTNREIHTVSINPANSITWTPVID